MKKYPIRVQSETKRVIKPENLMIEENALMKETSLDIAYGVANSIIKRRTKKVNTGDMYLYQYHIIEEKRPDYFVYEHWKGVGWTAIFLPIRAIIVISFQQIHNDVEVNFKMYKRFNNASYVTSRELTPEYARIVWIDCVLEFFKLAKVDNYDSLSKSLLTDELLDKRRELVRKSKIFIIKFLIVSLILILFPLLLQRL